jgi:large subunit ribosomal protein L25
MDLTAVKREQFGRKVRDLRKQGLIPAELYGHGLANEHVSVVTKDFTKVLRQAGESTLINLLVDGKKHSVFIHEVITNPVSDQIIGVDFYQVRMDEKLVMKVPVVFIGEAPAVKEKGGVLVKATHELKVEALPAEIPHEINVELSVLNDIGRSIRLSELKVPAGVKFLDEPNMTLVSIIAKMTEEQEAKLSATVDVSTIKSEGEEKVAERAAAKEAASPEGAAAPATSEKK